MARTGYKVTVYLDDNPNSSGYMETYEERVLDEETCPIEQDDFILVATECEVVFSGKTGYRVDIYYNNTTGEYKQEKALDPECEASTDEEVWVPSGDPFCETTEQGVNTGYMVQLVVQKNQLLPNYGETKYNRWKSPECGSNNCAIWDDLQKQCHVSVMNCVATFDGTADVTQIDINPLSSTYNQTRTINKQDSDCENCTETTFSWVLVGDMCGDDELLCSNGIQQTSTNSYTVHRKYKTIGSASPVPMDEYQVVLKTEDDEDCGYIRPIYEMRRMPGEYLCDTETYTKYEKYSKYVSYDLGETWSLVTPEVSERGDVIAYDSYDCGKPMYRWVFNGEFMCEDNGDDGKIRFYNSFSNGEFSDLESSVPCNESDVLTSSEVSSVSQTLYRRVGDCVRVVPGNVATHGTQGWLVVVWLGDYTEEIENITDYNGGALDIPERVNKINTISRTNYFENLVMMPPYPISATSVFQGGSGLEEYCAIWVAADTYELWKEDAFWGNFDARENYIPKLMPMNNDSVSWKARIRMKSNFNDWYYFIPDGEDETTITDAEGRYGRAIISEIKLSDKIKTLTRSSFGNDNNGYREFSKLEEIDLGHGIETIEYNTFKINNYLDSLTLPESLTLVRAYGLNMHVKDLYVNCAAEWEGVEFVNTGINSDRVHVVNIQNILSNTFHDVGCSFFANTSTTLYIGDNLVTDLVIPDSITEIGQYSFGRLQLNSLTVPSGVSVSNNAFLGHINDAYLESMVKLPDVSRVHVACSGLLEYNSLYFNNSGDTKVVISEMNKCTDSPFKDITLYGVTNRGIYGDLDDYASFGVYGNGASGTVTYKVVGKTVSLYRRTSNNYYGNCTISVWYGDTRLAIWGKDGTNEYVYFSETFDELSDGENIITISGSTTENNGVSFAIPLNTSSQTRAIATLHQIDGTNIAVSRASNLLETNLKWSDIEPYSSTTSSITVYDCNSIQSMNFDEMENLQTLVFNTATPPSIAYDVTATTKPYRVIVPCEYYPRYMNSYAEKPFANRIESESYDCLTEEWIVESNYCDAISGKLKVTERKYLRYGDDSYKTDETRINYGSDCIRITDSGFEPYYYIDIGDNYFKGCNSTTMDFEYLLDGGLSVTIYPERGARPYYYVYANTYIYDENGNLLASTEGTKWGVDVELESHKKYHVTTDEVRPTGCGGIKFNI